MRVFGHNRMYMHTVIHKLYTSVCYMQAYNIRLHIYIILLRVIYTALLY